MENPENVNPCNKHVFGMGNKITTTNDNNNNNDNYTLGLCPAIQTSKNLEYLKAENMTVNN